MPEQGRCRDCRWWVVFNRSAVRPEDLNQRISPRVCALMTISHQWPDHPESKAQACDGDDYLAWVVTAPDFGCIQHEAKERG